MNDTLTIPKAELSEMSVLGAVIGYPACMDVVTQILPSPAMFANHRHRAIYSAVLDCHTANPTYDPPAVGQRLIDMGVFTDIGGEQYLNELIDATPHPVGVEHHAEVVRDRHMIARLIEVTVKAQRRSQDAGMTAAQQIESLEQELFAIRNDQLAGQTQMLGQVLQQMYDDMADSETGQKPGITTGFYELDALTGGFHRGELILIAARPSIGKTSLAMNMADNMAVRDQLPVVFFSLEMNRQDIGQRLWAAHSGVPMWKIRNHQLKPEDFTAIAEAQGRIGASPLLLDDSPLLTVAMLRAKCRRIIREHKIRCVFVDYLQLMDGPGDGLREKVTMISAGLKSIAREIQLPLVCMSQLNRQAANREDHTPRMSELRESGSLEQDADVILMLHREDVYHRGAKDYTPDGKAELVIEKHRMGPTGKVDLQFDESSTSFRNMLKQRQSNG